MSEVADYTGSEVSVPMPPAPVVLASDGPLYLLPPNAQNDWKPVLDSGSGQVVIGFYSNSGNIKKVYDLEGKLLSISEPGLENSYIWKTSSSSSAASARLNLSCAAAAN
jgi:hypothetical protein